MWTFFSFAMLSVLVAIVFILRWYCAKTVPYIVRFVTAYAWLVSMSVVVLVPIDVYSTLSHQDESNDQAIFGLWAWAYWSTQVLTWLLLPFFMVYSDAGDFTVGGKSLTSLKENGILYGSAGLCCGIGAVILLIRGMVTPAGLMAVGMTCSNCFGFLASILMLGYGLVEVPRGLWRSQPEISLKWCAHRVGKYGDQVGKTIKELEKVVVIIVANQKQMRRHDNLKPYMDLIADFCEKESPVKPSEMAGRGADVESVRSEDLEYNYDKKGLAGLRRRMYKAIHRYEGVRMQYVLAIESAFEFEDIIKARQQRFFEPPPQYLSKRVPAVSKLVWKYKCVVRPVWHKVSAVILGIMSLIIIWCAISIAIPKPDLSPLSHMLRSGHPGEVSTQLLVLLPLVYISACTYSALFSISVFDYNKLIPHATAGSALMQNGSFMCRFVAPVAWNYFHMIHMTKDINGEKPAFSDLMGNMDSVLPWFSTHLNTYVPAILVVHCALVALGLWNKLLSMCVSDKYKFTQDDMDDDEYTEKGRGLIAGERECVSKGFPVGQMLQDAVSMGEVGGIKKLVKKGLFGSKKALAAEKAAAESAIKSAPLPTPTPQPKEHMYKSSAASAAAQKWLGRSSTPADTAPSSLYSAPVSPSPSSLTSVRTPALTSTAPTPSPLFSAPATAPKPSSGLYGGPAPKPSETTNTTAGGGGAASGGSSKLDGIFSDLKSFGKPKGAVKAAREDDDDERSPMFSRFWKS